MIRIGKIISTARDNFKRLLVTMLVDGVVTKGAGDVRTPKQVASYGIDSNPIPNKRALYVKSGKDGKYYVVGTLVTEGRAEPGEIRLYSTLPDGDEEQMYLHLKNNGLAEFGGDDDNLMRFIPAKDGFDELREDLNDLIIKFNAHVHTSAAPASPTSPQTGAPATASSANINGAKIDEIKTL